MSDTYTSIFLRGANRQSVIDAVEQTGRAAFVGQEHGDGVVVYPEGEADQDAVWLAARLSRTLACAAWQVAVINDDVLTYTLFAADGGPTDRYDSNPGYEDTRDQSPAGGDAARLAAAFALPDPDGALAADIETALRVTPIVTDPTAEIDFEEMTDYPYLSASDRLRDLCDLLLLPEDIGIVGTSFATLDRGIPPSEGISVADLHLFRPLRPTPLRHLLLLDAPPEADAEALAAWLDGEYGTDETALSPFGTPSTVAEKLAAALPEADTTSRPDWATADFTSYTLDFDLTLLPGTETLLFVPVYVWGPDAATDSAHSHLRRLIEFTAWRLFDTDNRAFV